jgi:hypothetical protein
MTEVSGIQSYFTSAALGERAVSARFADLTRSFVTKPAGLFACVMTGALIVAGVWWKYSRFEISNDISRKTDLRRISEKPVEKKAESIAGDQNREGLQEKLEKVVQDLKQTKELLVTTQEAIQKTQVIVRAEQESSNEQLVTALNGDIKTSLSEAEEKIKAEQKIIEQEEAALRELLELRQTFLDSDKLEYRELPEELQKDEEVAVKVLERNPADYEILHESLRNEGFILNAVKQGWLAEDKIPQELRKNTDFMSKVQKLGSVANI